MSQVNSTNSAMISGTALCQDLPSVSSPASDPHSSNVAATPVVSELPTAKQPTTMPMPSSAAASNATSTNQRAQPSQNPKQKAADTSSGKLLLRVAGQNDTWVSQFLLLLRHQSFSNP